MKKLVIAALAATAFVATPALANTDTTLIQGTVNPVCQLDAPNNTQVNLSGTSNLASNLTLTCNDPDGFTFSLSSANGFQLESADTSSTTVYPYTLVSPLGNTNANVTYNMPADAQAVAGWNIPVDVLIGTPSGPAYAGNYQDVLTWTVTAN